MVSTFNKLRFYYRFLEKRQVLHVRRQRFLKFDHRSLVLWEPSPRISAMLAYRAKFPKHELSDFLDIVGAKRKADVTMAVESSPLGHATLPGRVRRADPGHPLQISHGSGSRRSP